MRFACSEFYGGKNVQVISSVKLRNNVTTISADFIDSMHLELIPWDHLNLGKMNFSGDSFNIVNKGVTLHHQNDGSVLLGYA